MRVAMNVFASLSKTTNVDVHCVLGLLMGMIRFDRKGTALAKTPKVALPSRCLGHSARPPKDTPTPGYAGSGPNRLTLYS